MIVGKANPAFQQYLRDQHAGITGGAKVPHAKWGASVAYELHSHITKDRPFGLTVAYLLFFRAIMEGYRHACRER